MTTIRDFPDYINYSEIDYLLSSNLAETPFGVNKLMDRLILFDSSKRHIPYLLLIHKVFYNSSFQRGAKFEVVNDLIKMLYSNIISGSKRNQLCDFFPPYYVLRLLSDLYLAGYNINKLLKGLELDSKYKYDLTSYSDFSIDILPISLWKFFNINQRTKGNHLAITLAYDSLKAMNLNGFYDLIRFIQDKAAKTHYLSVAAKIHIYRNEISEALKLADSVSNEVWRSTFYLQIGLSLSETNKISILRELKHAIAAPELLIGIIFGMLDYHGRRNDESIVNNLLGEAEVYLSNINNYRIRIYRQVWLMKLLNDYGKIQKYNSCLEGYYIMESFLKQDEKQIAKKFFYHHLIAVGQTELVKQDSYNWFVKGDPKDADWQEDNRDVFFQIMVEEELDSIDLELLRHRVIAKNIESIDPTKLYHCVMHIAAMVQEEFSRDFSLEIIAKRMAKHGFYEEAIKVRSMIKEVEYHNTISFSLPMAAIANGSIVDALKYAASIPDEKQRLSVQLCMTPHLEKMNQTDVASTFIREWANYIFQYS